MWASYKREEDTLCWEFKYNSYSVSSDSTVEQRYNIVNDEAVPDYLHCIGPARYIMIC